MTDNNTAAALTADAKKQLAANKRRAAALLALIERRKTRISEDFYDIGEALKELLDGKLYGAMGFDSFEQMLEARKVMGATQAFKLIRLVEGIPRDEALRLGQEKAYALVTYTAATPEQDVPAALVRRNAKIDGKSVSQMSSRELLDATTAARAAVDKPLTPAAKARQKADQMLVKAARAMMKKAGVSKPDIQVKKDVVVVTIPRATVEKRASS